MNMETLGSVFFGIPSTCNKFLVLNTDIIGVWKDAISGNFSTIPLLLTFLSVVIMNIKFWDFFNHRSKPVNDPTSIFKIFLEAIGHWVSSNFSLSLAIVIHKWIYHFFTEETPRTTGVSAILHKITKRGEESVESLSHPWIPLVITGILSVCCLLKAIKLRLGSSLKEYRH